MLLIRSVLTFFLSTIAFTFLLLSNLSGADAPFVRKLYFSKIEDDLGQYFWTMYNFCYKADGDLSKNADCTSSKAGYPYEPYKWSSGFSDTAVYKGGSKAAYGMILCSLIVIIPVNVAGIMSFLTKGPKCFDIYKWGTLVVSLLVFVAVVLETALHKSGSDKIATDGVYKAYLGKTIFAFLWIAFAFEAFSFLACQFWVDKSKQQEPAEEKWENYNEYPLENNPAKLGF